MEELQDAIEDAQYVNAISTQEEGPRPVLSWDIPNEEQLAEWEAKVRRKSRLLQRTGEVPVDAYIPDPFTCDWYLSSAIGLFLFSSYLKEEKSDYLRINFLEEVIRWRKLRGKHRLERAKKIVEVYLKELPLDEVTGEKVLPEKTQIDEYDLSRSDPPRFDAELQQLAQISWDEAKATNCLGLKGAVIEDVLQTLKVVEKAMASAKASKSSASKAAEAAAAQLATEEPPKEQSSSARRPPPSDQTTVSAPPTVPTGNISVSSFIDDAVSVASGNSAPAAPVSQRDAALKKQMEKYSSLRELTQSYRSKSDTFLPDSVFDKVDALVVESLRKEYWEGFTQSEKFTRLRNFLWFQDRRVVPDDFFTMRVLGRGGFGSVIGKFEWGVSRVIPCPSATSAQRCRIYKCLFLNVSILFVSPLCNRSI